MTDPRIAALAEALRKVEEDVGFTVYEAWPTEQILAALPADWCAEAVAAERERIAAAVEGLPPLWDANVPIGDDPYEACRAAVLAIVRGEL